MAYTVLARRYRSQTFDDVVGQEPIAQTLKNAIQANRIHHAYLFTGTRGVGKTSMARILAKALNCTGPDGSYTAPTLTPCGQCNSCLGVARGDDLDVIEIDGASNNSVENVRDLISNSVYRPARSRYKVYIIDEVHMLSTSAFNALLKTLEEPPEHVKFIFATTESHKVLATILSRCQRFDFRNIPVGRIAAHLVEVAKGESITVEQPVIFEVARQANGSMRDALSLLDRLLATGQNPITPLLLEQMLGLPDQTLIQQLLEAMIGGDPASALKAGAELLNRVSIDQMLEALIGRLRHLMLAAACGGDSELIEVDEQTRQVIAAQAKQFDLPGLVHMIVLCENAQRQAKFSSTSRALVEALLVRLAMSERFMDLATAMKAGQLSGPSGASAGQAPRAASAPPPPPGASWAKKAPGPTAPPTPGRA